MLARSTVSYPGTGTYYRYSIPIHGSNGQVELRRDGPEAVGQSVESQSESLPSVSGRRRLARLAGTGQRGHGAAGLTRERCYYLDLARAACRWRDALLRGRQREDPSDLGERCGGVAEARGELGPRRSPGGRPACRMQAAGEEGDGDDPVVRELDVFLSHGLANALYLLQFPLQNKHSADPSEMLRATSACRMKPHRNLLEVDLALDTECSNYDPDSRLSAPTRTIKSHTVPAKANYTVGALKGDELHLTPLHAALQMRPSFQLVDELDAKDKEASGQAKEDPRARAAAKKAEASSGAPDVYKVTIKRAETERTIERRQRSHAYLEREQKKEPWVDVELHGIASDSAALARDKLFADNTGGPALPTPLPKQDYLDLLSPPVSAPEEQAAASGDPASSADNAWQAVVPGQQFLSMHLLRQMNLAQQASAVLRHSGVVRFDRLVTVLQIGPEHEDELIEILEGESTLIQGCWVVKSSIACSTDRDQAYRDKLCLALVQDEVVSYSKFCEATGIVPSAASTLFESLTVKESARGRRLKVAADINFCAEHPKIVERHRAAWLARADEINGRFGSTVMDVGASAGVQEGGGDGVGDTSGRHARTVRALLERHGVATRRLIAQQLEQDGASPQLIDGVIERLCVQLTDGESDAAAGYCLRSYDSDAVDRYRNVVVGLLQEHEKVRKTDINAAARAQLGEELPSQLYSKICKELATSQGQVWIRKTPVATNE